MKVISDIRLDWGVLIFVGVGWKRGGRGFGRIGTDFLTRYAGCLLDRIYRINRIFIGKEDFPLPLKPCISCSSCLKKFTMPERKSKIPNPIVHRISAQSDIGNHRHAESSVRMPYTPIKKARGPAARHCNISFQPNAAPKRGNVVRGIRGALCKDGFKIKRLFGVFRYPKEGWRAPAAKTTG